MSRYIFTVTAGRSGQNTLSNILDNHLRNSYVAFEEPQINYIFRGRLADFERAFRRKFIETHEMLGRGKILTAFVGDDVDYIYRISRKRMNLINNKMEKNGDQLYVDVSKYFARGLHLGFQAILPKFSLIHLVRDPILNMRSFLNRNKNFYLDNNSPDADNNLLKLNSQNMKLSDLYLWAWCEMALRYEKMKKMSCVENYVEIYTNQLNNPGYINRCLDDLGLVHDRVQKNKIRLNTNSGSGYKKTEIQQVDVEMFESFMKKVPNRVLQKIPYLREYDPYSAHNIY